MTRFEDSVITAAHVQFIASHTENRAGPGGHHSAHDSSSWRLQETVSVLC